MLEIRPNCECCDVDLLPSANDAVICSFECTFCKSCAERLLNFVCPNCAGELVKRPVRPEQALANFPASDKRVVKDSGCVAAV